MKRITISDIAKKLKTTPTTVSRALNDHPRISKSTKKQILEYAKEVGFEINKVASSLRSGRTNIIGVLIPSAQINFFGSVVHGIEMEANTKGYTVMICQTNEKRDYEVKGLETFLSARVDGILASVAKETKDFSHFLNVKNKGVPIAFFDRSTDKVDISSIVIDDFKGAFEATTHLIDQGYKNIAHISGPTHMKVFADRLKGYRSALEERNLKFDERLVFTGDISIEAGENGVAYFLKENILFDAIFAVEDFTALGVVKALKDQNIVIPDDVGVIGFANEQLDEFITPTLSSVDQQTVLMGKKSFELILEMIEGKSTDNVVPHKNIVLSPQPIYRESTNRLSKKSTL